MKIMQECNLETSVVWCLKYWAGTRVVYVQIDTQLWKLWMNCFFFPCPTYSYKIVKANKCQMNGVLVTKVLEDRQDINEANKIIYNKTFPEE